MSLHLILRPSKQCWQNQQIFSTFRQTKNIRTCSTEKAAKMVEIIVISHSLVIELMKCTFQAQHFSLVKSMVFHATQETFHPLSILCLASAILSTLEIMTFL